MNLFGQSASGRQGAPMGAAGPALFVLPDRQANPTDTPQSVKFSPTNPAVFSCVSWDQKLRAYTVSGPQAVAKAAEVELGHFPLSQCWSADGKGCFVALGDGALAQVDFGTMQVSRPSVAPAPLLQLANFARGGFLVGIANDKRLLVYGLNGGPRAAPDFALSLREQPLCFALDGQTLLLCLARSKFIFLDLAAINQYREADVQLLDSQLAAPISCAHVDESSREYCLASADGRVYKGFFGAQPTPAGRMGYSAQHSAAEPTRNFTFLGQARKRGDTLSDLYSINCMGGHPRSRAFLYTAGSDGVLNLWDTQERNKIAAYTAPGPIACGDLSPDGQTLALGIGYDWSQGVWGLPEATYAPAVAVKRLGENELHFRRG